MVLLIDNIITPYEIDRYNRIHNDLHGKLVVWFHSRTEKNRNWKQLPKTRFKYYISNDQLFHSDLIRFLHANKHTITRIISCGWNNPIYWYCLIFSKMYNIRFTLWSGSTVYEKGLLRRLVRPLVKVFISFSSDYIAYGTRAKEYLVSLGASKKDISIYYNSVDVDFFHKKSILLKKIRVTLRKKYSIPLNHTVLLFVGQLIDRKGILELIHAYLKIYKTYRNVTLFIVGNGELKNRIQELIKENPEASIVQIDHIEYFQMPEIYAISDTLILPSKEEVWGLVVNEAMASGLPVLVSKNSGCSDDLVKNFNNGLIIDYSMLGIQISITKLLTLSEIQKRSMGRGSVQMIQKIYSTTSFI